MEQSRARGWCWRRSPPSTERHRAARAAAPRAPTDTQMPPVCWFGSFSWFHAVIMAKNAALGSPRAVLRAGHILGCGDAPAHGCLQQPPHSRHGVLRELVAKDVGQKCCGLWQSAGMGTRLSPHRPAAGPDPNLRHPPPASPPQTALPSASPHANALNRSAAQSPAGRIELPALEE